MFKTRILSGIVLVAAALLTICSGGAVLFATTWIISLIGMRELYRAMGVHREKTGLLEMAGYGAVTLYYDPGDVRLCIYLSPLQSGGSDGSGLRCSLCGSDALLRLPDQRTSGRSLACMADPPLLLGV